MAIFLVSKSLVVLFMVSPKFIPTSCLQKTVKISHFWIRIKMPIYRAWHIIRVQTSRNKSWIFFEGSTVKTATITEIVHAVPVFVGGGLVRETDGVLLDALILLIFI